MWVRVHYGSSRPYAVHAWTHVSTAVSLHQHQDMNIAHIIAQTTTHKRAPLL